VRRMANTVRPWAPLLFFAVLISVPAVARLFFDIAYEVFNAIGGDPFAAAEGFDRLLFWQN